MTQNTIALPEGMHITGEIKPGYEQILTPAALALIATPLVVRTTEDVLRLQPPELREAGLALGAGRARVIRRIVWKAGRRGLVTAALLGFARISGETSARNAVG